MKHRDEHRKAAGRKGGKQNDQRDLQDEEMNRELDLEDEELEEEEPEDEDTADRNM
jgi:hypothetical protein